MLKKLIIVIALSIAGNTAYADGFSKKLLAHSDNEKQIIAFAKASQLLQQNDLTAAQAALEPQHPRYNNHHKRLVLLAAIAIKQDNPQQAIDLLLRTAEQHRSNRNFLSILAMAYYNAGLYDLALANYHSLVTQQAHNNQWWLGMATTLDAKGELKAALESYVKVKTLGNLNLVAANYVNNRIIAISNIIAK